MSNEKIKRLLAELREALEEAPDAEARRLIGELDADIHEMLDEETGRGDPASLRERVTKLEADFAAEHPTLEPFLRQIADWLAKMGV
jgi:polyhydroxyalkanoate synthesis regulator phasin